MASPTARPLKVIALISGGKDSMFSILHCRHQNHQIIALANLHPPFASPSGLSDATDLNSYMYQTAGHNLIPHYSSLLNLPLYRRSISGSAIDTSRDYVPPLSTGEYHQRDETEDLTRLLQEIMTVHPDANAVCSGAILSTYQRTRVESVCVRLGLVPLAPLWQYPLLPTPSPSPAGLLDDMASVGLEARVVKVASGGLDTECLWKDVTQGTGRRMVEKAAARFGASVLGEGGEFETLVVAGPKHVWKGRLHVEEHEKVVMVGQGGEAWLVFGKGRVDLDEGDNVDAGAEESWRRALTVPSLWDAAFEKIYPQETEATTDRLDQCERPHSPNRLRQLQSMEETWQATQVVVASHSTISISNMAARGKGNTTDRQMADICDELTLLLRGYHRSPDDIVFTTILLRAMADFAQANAVYGRLFTRPHPPARVTVACGNSLPRNVNVMLSCIVDRGHGQHRNGLHVQSRSFWAPANIGPYSQAVSLRLDQSPACLVFLAGQIPLVPISMDVLQLGRLTVPAVMDSMLFQSQALLSLQHLWRIGTAMSVIWWTAAIAFIVGEDDAHGQAAIASRLWRNIHHSSKQEDLQHEEDDELDAWDRVHRGQRAYFHGGDTTWPLPDLSSVLFESPASPVPAFFAVQVSELPRECPIEWQSLGYASSKVKVEDCLVAGMHGQTCTALDTRTSVLSLEMPWECMASRSYVKVFSELGLMERTAGQADDHGHATLYTSHPAIFEAFRGQIVPCKNVWNVLGTNLLAGLIMRKESAESS